MKDKFVRLSLGLIFFAIATFLAHYFLTNHYLPNQAKPMPIWLIYLILTVFALFLLFMIYRKMNKSKGGGAKAFIIVSVIKMIAVFVILLIFMFPKTDDSKFVVYHFFLAFFPFLFVETLCAIRLINHRFAEKNKIS